MAMRHFDSRGFPKLKEIIREICQYVRGLEVEYTDYPFAGNIITPKNREYGNRIVSSDVDFVQGIPTKPFKVNGIYVVGGQVAYLPDSYNTGEHDLDMIVKTNADTVTFSRGVEYDILDELEKVLNDGKEDLLDKKEFVLDIFKEHREETPLRPPYLQIFPKMKRIDS